MTKKINILGTQYDYIESSSKEHEDLMESDGLHYGFEKKIKIDITACDSAPQSKDEYIKKVKRHELIHAFFYESGCAKQHRDEELVDWIAYQFPKMLAAFKEVDAI